ncbi:Ig-like domain-containing protein [Desulfosporosinus sp. FKA]|uniref:Ig-like domain-containing protein n=1 Tax=Desulfosporosinus sp. FKA TaxID=1969834 RepID=UPI0015519E05|nr:Ig-like domain-containing protein [Desulfosporosinus sp. FKA]
MKNKLIFIILSAIILIFASITPVFADPSPYPSNFCEVGQMVGGRQLAIGNDGYVYTYIDSSVYNNVANQTMYWYRYKNNTLIDSGSNPPMTYKTINFLDSWKKCDTPIQATPNDVIEIVEKYSDGTVVLGPSYVGPGHNVYSTNDDHLKVLLDVAEQAQLSVTSSLSDNASLTWTSSDPTVAKVDANGKVTAVKEGICNITAAKSDNSFTDYIPVKVLKGAENLRLALNLKAGESKRLWIADDASSVTWTSMDPSVASVDSTGKVKGVANGLCIVQGVYSGKTYTIYVRVNS